MDWIIAKMHTLLLSFLQIYVHPTEAKKKKNRGLKAKFEKEWKKRNVPKARIIISISLSAAALQCYYVPLYCIYYLDYYCKIPSLKTMTILVLTIAEKKRFSFSAAIIIVLLSLLQFTTWYTKLNTYPCRALL